MGLGPVIVRKEEWYWVIPMMSSGFHFLSALESVRGEYLKRSKCREVER